MILSNPFFLIQVIFMVGALAWANYMDGAEMPPRRYNFTQTFVSVVINFFLLYGAVLWAHAH